MRWDVSEDKEEGGTGVNKDEAGGEVGLNKDKEERNELPNKFHEEIKF